MTIYNSSVGETGIEYRDYTPEEAATLAMDAQVPATVEVCVAVSALYAVSVGDRFSWEREPYSSIERLVQKGVNIGRRAMLWGAYVPSDLDMTETAHPFEVWGAIGGEACLGGWAVEGSRDAPKLGFIPSGGGRYEGNGRVSKFDNTTDKTTPVTGKFYINPNNGWPGQLHPRGIQTKVLFHQGQMSLETCLTESGGTDTFYEQLLENVSASEAMGYEDFLNRGWQ